MEEPLAGNFDDHTFRPQKIQFAPDMIDHQLPNCRVGQCSEFLLEQRSHAQCADDLLKESLGTSEPPLFFDEALHADFFVSAVVGVHAFQLYPFGFGNR